MSEEKRGQELTTQILSSNDLADGREFIFNGAARVNVNVKGQAKELMAWVLEDDDGVIYQLLETVQLQSARLKLKAGNRIRVKFLGERELEVGTVCLYSVRLLQTE